MTGNGSRGRDRDGAPGKRKESSDEVQEHRLKEQEQESRMFFIQGQERVKEKQRGKNKGKKWVMTDDKET